MEIVSFEIAKKLKEKGFREKCYRHCYPDSKDWFLSSSPECGNYSSYLDIPTISQVLKWLRKTHNLFIVVFLNDDSDNPVTFEIYKGTECVTDYHIKYYPLDEWSKAEIDAIKYVIDNLI